MPEKRIDVVEAASRVRKGWTPLVLNSNVEFSTKALESYALAVREDVIVDAMVVAAAVEYADVVTRRPLSWARHLSIRIPVHDPGRWNSPSVSDTLHDALGFVTGDRWSVVFLQRRRFPDVAPESYLSLSVPTETVLAFSDGMDSLAVAGILGVQLGDRLVRVRVGGKQTRGRGHGQAFTAVPYRIVAGSGRREPSARSRGFKFTLIAGIAAYLTDASSVVLPESGQGAIGPRLVNVGHSYFDFRNHPQFTQRMERFLSALLDRDIAYELPRLWSTKGETLREFVDLGVDGNWQDTKSCWKGNRWSSVNGRWRHCGVCAACLLRRVSVHAAGLSEAPDTYVTSRMNAESLESAVDPGFRFLNDSFRDYGIAGVLHMDHLAALATREGGPFVSRHAVLLAQALGQSHRETERLLRRLLSQHAQEWNQYLASLGPRSFVRQWVRGNR